MTLGELRAALAYYPDNARLAICAVEIDDQGDSTLLTSDGRFDIWYDPENPNDRDEDRYPIVGIAVEYDAPNEEDLRVYR